MDFDRAMIAREDSSILAQQAHSSLQYWHQQQIAAAQQEASYQASALQQMGYVNPVAMGMIRLDSGATSPEDRFVEAQRRGLMDLFPWCSHQEVEAALRQAYKEETKEDGKS